MGMKYAVWIAAIVLGTARVAHAIVPITSCNQIVPVGERGVLQNDIDCRWSCSEDRSVACDRDGDCTGKGLCDAETLILARDAVLDLDGHRLSAPIRGYGVYCGGRKANPGRCVVRGPGRIDRGIQAVLSQWSDILVTDVELLGDYGAVKGGGHVEVRHSRVPYHVDNVIYGAKSVTLIDVEGSPAWIETRGDVVLRDVRLGPGFVEVHALHDARVRDVSSDGSVLFRARDVQLRRASSSDDEGIRVLAERRLRLVDTAARTITVGKEPRLVRSTCERSYVGDTEQSWGVCTND